MEGRARVFPSGRLSEGGEHRDESGDNGGGGWEQRASDGDVGGSGWEDRVAALKSQRWVRPALAGFVVVLILGVVSLAYKAVVEEGKEDAANVDAKRAKGVATVENPTATPLTIAAVANVELNELSATTGSPLFVLHRIAWQR